MAKKRGAQLFPEKKVKKFLDALVQLEHVPVSGMERTGANENIIMIGGKAVVFAKKHHGEKGIKEPYINQMINAATESKYGPPGTSEYNSGRKHLKKLARKIIGY